MPLYDTGHSYVETLRGQSARAHDSHEMFVTVSASREALEEFTWDIIWRVASAKYDANEFDIINSVRVVRVTIEDCGNAEFLNASAPSAA